MNIDFPLVLVLASVFTGVVWAVDAWFFAPKRRAVAASATAGEGTAGERERESEGEKAVKEPLLVEYSRSFFPIIVIVLLIRSFVVEPFRIPSGSMMPTLLVGDFILVNKFSYGLRLPVAHTEFLELGDPEPGDIIVFRYPEDPNVDYIKRVVGVGGDHVVYKDKVLYINGKRMEQQLLDTYVGEGTGSVMTGARRLREDLRGVEHEILVMANRFDRDFEFTVPEGEYFVMGDNRDNSRDSRYWGTVPDENLVGKAFLIWMNWDSKADGVQWGRIGTVIE